MSKKYGELRNYDIIMEGTMKKSPPQKPKAFFNFITKLSCIDNSDRTTSMLGQRWRNRHFVLYKTAVPSQVNMLYFKVEPSPECKNIGSVDLLKLTNVSVDVGCTVNRSNVFSIQTIDDKGNNRIYYLCAPTSDMMNMWVDKIVTSLNLNNYSNSRYSYTQIGTLPSPAHQHLPRGLTRITPYCVSTPKLSSALWSASTSPEAPRYPLHNVIDRSNGNTSSSYYNLSPGKSSLFHETLEDPILAEDEDIYKYPCETPNQHAYVNLNEERKNPVPFKDNTPGTIFFANNDILSQYKCDSKSMEFPVSPQCQLPDNNQVLEYQNISTYQSQATSPLQRQIDIDDVGFDFPLPTRIRNDSSSSTGSSSSSSSEENQSFNHDLSNNVKTNPTIDQSPPKVPKRLNLQESTKPNTTISETVLPIKTPKLLHQKIETSDLYGNLCDEPLSSLNYVDAENLLLDNRNHQSFDLCFDSIYSSLLMPPSDNVHTTIPLSSSEFNCTDTNSCRDITTVQSKCNGDDPSQIAIFPASNIFKDMVPSVEYREICDARTEALLKLSNRIHNNE